MLNYNEEIAVDEELMLDAKAALFAYINKYLKSLNENNFFNYIIVKWFGFFLLFRIKFLLVFWLNFLGIHC